MKILVLMLLNVLVSSCGSRYVEYRQDKEPQQQPDEGWSEVIQPIVDARCSPCHAQAAFVRSGSTFKASAAKSQIRTGLMPPPGSGPAREFTTEEKELLLAY